MYILKLLDESESPDEGHFEVVQARSAPVARNTHAEVVPLVSVVPDAFCIFIACAETEIFGLMHSAEPCGPMTMPRT